MTTALTSQNTPYTPSKSLTSPSRYLINILLGQSIRRYREAGRLSQEMLAERAGCHPSYLSSIENGRADLSIKTFDRLCKALAVSSGYLYCEAEVLATVYRESAPSGDDLVDPLATQCWLESHLRQTARHHAESGMV